MRAGLLRHSPTVALLFGIAYMVFILSLFSQGLGIPAAYLTMPAWYFVGSLVFLLALGLPESLNDVLFSWTGNFVLLLLSAALNAGTVYVAVLRYSKNSSDASASGHSG